ncbi:MAG: PIN domain-containing protein [Bacteroidota bacterium]
MEKAIFDTSVWIDLDKNISSRQSLLLEEYADFYNDKIYLTPTIIQEILQGLKTEGEYNYKRNVLLDFNILNENWLETSIAAAKLYFDLRKKGVTIRKSTDCLIAQVAIKNNMLLIHSDSDFELIAQNSSLRTFNEQ